MKIYSVADIPSGLNNQKLVLIGLCHIAIEDGAKVKLPLRIVDFSPRPKFIRKQFPDGYLAFNDVFDLKQLHSALYENDLFCEHPATFNVDFHTAFRVGVTAVRAIRGSCQKQSLASDLLIALRPAPHLTELASFMWSEIKGLQHLVGVQLRIERDWVEYLERKGDFNTPRTPAEIFRIMTDKFRGANLLLCCDEDDLLVSKSSILESAHNFGFQAFFKSDLKASHLLPNSRLQRSVIEFDICLKLSQYVGLSRSTFSNMLALYHYCANVDALHYQYDCL